jgi:hypothetical protein
MKLRIIVLCIATFGLIAWTATALHGGASASFLHNIFYAGVMWFYFLSIKIAWKNLMVELAKRGKAKKEKRKRNQFIYYVDLPDPHKMIHCGPDGVETVSVADFDDEQWAIHYAQKYLGADSQGRIKVVTKVEEE